MENKCSICKTEEELVDAIGKEEIVSICRSCAEKNNLPIVQKPTLEQINRSARFRPISERFPTATPIAKNVSIKPKETSASKREIEKMVIQNTSKKDYAELIDNFHWHIQQARRFKKLSQKQLSELIGEPEVLISMAEEAKLPEDYDKLINKLEQFLQIPLRKEPKKAEAFSQGIFNIKKADLNIVTTSDLKNAREEMILAEVKQKVDEKENKKGFWSRIFGSDDEITNENANENEEFIDDVEEIKELRERNR